ncbi:uncharacterized protein BDZ99DRAFT_489398 [Mytilinidion resinicola]|uniref:Uncharacterized protein n=1 Tax=Mytilinidion resinicola TaxID=574789 RepID=A0A6A6YGZ8_9PEZI|nr:uncharacterized protein BDZ99DRAFT_489398 [Mytilinidion resinicola]KAF2807813.1 hypothetical protein BDZ99DRAFT_489398 [Mytilinidion resinicola]
MAEVDKNTPKTRPAPDWVPQFVIDYAWLNGVAPDAEGRTKNAVSCCIIITDTGNGTGGVVLNNQLGDHVGDWEHNIVRFANGEPKYVWYSQHSNGQAFQYRVLKKDKSGKRPLAYCANGSHAVYATSGIHDHTVPNLNLPFPFLLVDETNAAGTPVNWLYFLGKWGDEQHPDKGKRQKQLAGNRKYVGGPTGPADKQLNRKKVCLDNGKQCHKG